MILLITSSSAGRDCKLTLQDGCGKRVHLVGSIGEATIALREREYSVVVIDALVARHEANDECHLLNHCRGAFPVFVNLGVSSCGRVLAEVKSALRRRHVEHLAAMRIANSELRDGLKNAVTGILLSSELALAVPELPRSAQVKLKFVHDLAQGMRRHLET